MEDEQRNGELASTAGAVWCIASRWQNQFHTSWISASGYVFLIRAIILRFRNCISGVSITDGICDGSRVILRRYSVTFGFCQVQQNHRNMLLLLLLLYGMLKK